MSLDATVWAWKQRELRPAEKLILLSFADRAGEDHTAWPAASRLVKDTGLDRKTIVKSIRTLVAGGYIKDTGERKGRTKSTIVYQLIGVNGRENEAVPKTEQLKTSSPKNGTAKQSQKRNSLSASSPKNGRAKLSQKRDTESSIDNLEESRPAEASAPPLLSDVESEAKAQLELRRNESIGEFPECDALMLRAWLHNRRKAAKPITSDAVHTFSQQLAALDLATRNAALGFAVADGCHTIYPRHIKTAQELTNQSSNQGGPNETYADRVQAEFLANHPSNDADRDPDERAAAAKQALGNLDLPGYQVAE